MRITNVTLNANGAEVAELSFRDPGSVNPYKAKAIFGLDADEIVANFYGSCLTSDTKFHTLAIPDREIVLRIGLNPQFSIGKTYSDLRDDLYRAIASSRSGMIELRFNNGLAPVAAISGFITKFEAPHFNKEPEVQITIKCERNKAMLKAVSPVMLDPYMLAPSDTIIDSISTAPHGFKFNITFNATSDIFLVQDSTDCSWSFTVEPGTIGASTGFLVDDVLYFSSEMHDKYLYVVRAGETIHLISKIHPNSKWPVLFPNANDFEFRSLDLVLGEVVFGDTKAFTFNEFSYYPTFWGV